MINGPNRPTCSVRSAPNAEPAPPSCCRPATPKLCSFTSMRSQPKSLRALTPFSSSIKPAGMAPRPSRFQATSRSCSSRHAHPNSTAKKISGNSCGRTGCRTEFSNPSTISSITAVTPGTCSSISRGKSCPSPAAIGQPQVTQSEDWYKTALVTRDGDNKISVLSIDGNKVEHAKRDISAGLRPYGLVIHPNGKVAAVANIGTSSGDADTVSLIDIEAKPARVVQTVTVGQTPEGIALSPDGAFLAVGVANGSNKPKSNPFFNDYGLVKVLSVKGNELVPLTEAKVGHWCQGLAWSKGNRMLLVQCMVEKEIMVLSFDGKELKPAGSIKLNAGPAGIRTAEP